jgi:hypothetical protein
MQLHQASQRIKKTGIRYCSFYEADIDNQLTAIATEPVFGKNRNYFKKYNCLKLK